MTKNSDRMYELAEYLDELNAKGEIKGTNHRGSGQGEECGYAFIVKIKQGIAIFLVHMCDGDLIIYLKLTPTAEDKYPGICEKATVDFTQFFPKMVKPSIWTHPANDRDQCKIFSYNATTLTNNDIIKIIDRLKDKFA